MEPIYLFGGAMIVALMLVQIGYRLQVAREMREEDYDNKLDVREEAGKKNENERWHRLFDSREKYSMFSMVSCRCDICKTHVGIPVLVQWNEEKEYECQGWMTKGKKKSIKRICLKCANKNKSKLTKWEG